MSIKKIGFIDLFIDEWHANNYPAWFLAASEKIGGGQRHAVALAWEEAPAGGRPLARWCEELSRETGSEIRPARSLGQVVEESDALCVLAPANPEAHERLAELALRSGKPVYIDKPFAPDRAAAERLFALAERHGTPLFSSSALRFADELITVRHGAARRRPEFVGTRGGGSSFAEYAVHQLEMIVSLLGPGARRVLHTGNDATDHLLIDYSDERRATLTLNGSLPFAATITGSSGSDSTSLDSLGGFFPNLIASILEFFSTGRPPVPSAETIEIASLLHSGIRASAASGRWVELWVQGE